MKNTDPLFWIGTMSTIKNQIEDIKYKENKKLVKDFQTWKKKGK